VIPKGLVPRQPFFMATGCLSLPNAPPLAHTTAYKIRKRDNFSLRFFCLSTDDPRFTTTYFGFVVRKLVVP